MTLAKVRDWLEVVGLFSVVLSLIFVGLQMKQAQDIAIASQYQARADHNLEINSLRYEDSGAMKRLGARVRPGTEASVKSGRISFYSLADLEATSDDDLGRIVAHCTLRLRQLDNNHFQWEMGMIEESAWNGLKNAAFQFVDLAGPCGDLFGVTANEYRYEMRALVAEMRADAADR